MLAALPDTVIASPLSFLAGLIVGLWLGARFLIIRKRADSDG